MAPLKPQQRSGRMKVMGKYGKHQQANLFLDEAYSVTLPISLFVYLYIHLSVYPFVSSSK